MIRHPLVAIVMCAGIFGAAAPANDRAFVLNPQNPRVWGKTGQSWHMMGTASAQRTATAFDADLDSDGGLGGGGSTPGSSDADLFVRQLQGRLLSALATQVTDAIFGDNPQNSGSVQFGGTTITFDRTLDSIRLVIEDANGTTEIIVPQLVTN